MRARILEAAAARLSWLVAIDGSAIIGYAYASKWKGRCAYRHSVESTVYLAPSSTGNGVGRKLHAALIDRLQDRGVHTVIGGIALPNEASIALHERLGFEKVAQFKQVGFKQDRRIDAGHWQFCFDACPLLAESRYKSETNPLPFESRLSIQRANILGVRIQDRVSPHRVLSLAVMDILRERPAVS